MSTHLGSMGRSSLCLMMMMLCATPVLLASASDNRSNQSDTAPAAQPAAAAPSVDLSPEEVVKLQMQALQANDDKDSGIATAFRFASPENQTSTGPLDHFIQLVKSEAYAPMLNCKTLHFGPSRVKDNQAMQIVTLTSSDGKIIQYQFVLSRQESGTLKGCWMTDGVQRMDDADPPKKT